MKLKWLFIDSLYLPSVCNLSPNSMIYHLLATASLLGGQPFTKKNLYHFLRYCRSGHAKMFNRWILDQRGRYRGSRSFLDQLYGLFHGRCSESYRRILREKQFKYDTFLRNVKSARIINPHFFPGYFYTVAYHTRIFEMVGYSISFVSILISLCILSAFRSLHTREKSIHRQLYLAMLIQVVIRLILYTDQYVSRQEDVTEDSRGIDNTVSWSRLSKRYAATMNDLKLYRI